LLLYFVCPRSAYLADTLALARPGRTAHPRANLYSDQSEQSGAGSLQQAISDANNHAGLDTINFNVSGSGIQFLFTNATLPTITDPVVIDATTQPGYAGTPLIHMEGMERARRSISQPAGPPLKGFLSRAFRGGCERDH
jgi:hypothetical protein